MILISAGGYQALMEGLEKTYQERHAQWEEEIFQRCVQK